MSDDRERPVVLVKAKVAARTTRDGKVDLDAGTHVGDEFVVDINSGQPTACINARNELSVQKTVVVVDTGGRIPLDCLLLSVGEEWMEVRG